MKLKKIVSLALAGVLAVSMLAGCKNDSTKEPASSSEQTTATGYSAKLADEMKDLADKDYIDFKDNASDEDALKATVANLANKDLWQGWNIWAGATAVNGGTSKVVGYFADGTEIAKDFEDKAGLNDYDVNVMFENAQENGTYKIGMVYAADGSVDMDKVIAVIAKDLEEHEEHYPLVENEKFAVAIGTLEYNYSYEISVSVVNVSNETFLEADYSTNFIAVTITRTGVDA